MRTLSKIFFYFLLLGIATQVYAVPTVGATPVMSNPQKSIIVSQSNPQFTITLASNPTTGYSWFLEATDRPRLEALNWIADQNERDRAFARARLFVADMGELVKLIADRHDYLRYLII